MFDCTNRLTSNIPALPGTCLKDQVLTLYESDRKDPPSLCLQAFRASCGQSLGEKYRNQVNLSIGTNPIDNRSWLPPPYR